jgi:hypothetical protein
MRGLNTVSLTNEGESPTSQALADGLEVELLAWRVVWWHQGPRMRYRVRTLDDGSEGWVWADFLKALPGLQAAAVREPVPRRRSSEAAAASPPTHTLAGALASPAGLSTVSPAKDDTTTICSVCRSKVNSRNVWRESNGTIIGCDICRGRRRCP